MVRVDFWQLSRDPAEKVAALIASRVLDDGERLLIVSADDAQLDAISKTLWETQPEAFMANGRADAPGADRQPILLANQCDPANGASHVILADGEWREEAAQFARSFLLFGEATLAAARECWRALDGLAPDGEGSLERAFFRQDDGKWTKIA